MQAFIKLQSYKLHLLIAIKNAYNSNGPNDNETCGKIIGKINNYSDVSARMRVSVKFHQIDFLIKFVN